MIKDETGHGLKINFRFHEALFSQQLYFVNLFQPFLAIKLIIHFKACLTVLLLMGLASTLSRLMKNLLYPENISLEIMKNFSFWAEVFGNLYFAHLLSTQWGFGSLQDKMVIRYLLIATNVACITVIKTLLPLKHS